MPVSPPTVPVPTPAAPPLELALPGGLRVAGVATQVGADSLTQALALVAAAGPAMAPLGPVFSIIDAVLAVKDFAQAVPELIVNPGAVVEAVVKLVQKIGKLLSLVPQLSVPLMILGVVDAVIALLGGLALQLGQIAAQEARIAAALEQAAELEATSPVAAAALTTIAGQATAQVAVQRADVATALGGAQPLLGIVNAFCGLIGLPGISLSVDVTSGGTAAAVDALNDAITALQTFRRTIPL